MKTFKNSEELMELLCSAAGVGAYGAGDVSLSPKAGGDFMKIYGGNIVRCKAVISASGFGGRKDLIRLADSAVKRVMDISGGDIIKVSAPFPAVIARAEKNGFIRVERDIEIIYRG